MNPKRPGRRMASHTAGLLPTVWLVAVSVAGCGGDSSAGSTQAGAPPVEDVGRTVSPDFAAELGVNLDSMTRSESGLYTLDIVEGVGLSARPGHVVTVRYTGWLANGEQFDGTEDGGEPFTFPLGAGRVISGWEQGVAGMRINGKRRLVIPPLLGYGPRGFPGAIPPNATLIFEIELLNIQM